MTETGSDRTRNIALGVGVLVIAVVVFAVTRNSAVSCELTAYGVEAIALGVTDGRSAQQIEQASDLVPPACESLIASLIEEPEAPVTFDLQLPQAGTLGQTVPGTDIIEPPEASANSPQRIVQCLGWSSSLLSRMCVDDFLPTPAPPATLP